MTGDMKRIVGACIAVLLVAGCARIKVSQEIAPDADLRALETFAWDEDRVQASRRLALSDADVRSEIERALVEIGYEKAAAGAKPDFLVAYRTSVKTKTSASAVNEPAGYSSGWGAHREDAGYRAVDSGGTYFEEWEQGRLVVDLLTPDGGRLLWRGTAKTQIHFENRDRERERRLRQAVTSLIGQIRAGR